MMINFKNERYPLNTFTSLISSCFL